MGVYMSTPVTEKTSEDKTCESFTYGASSMQGWRMSQEDAHNCLPDFDVETNTSLFAVYDGHGGAEVAKYCSSKLPDFIKTIEKYKKNELALSLKEAFLGFDEILTRNEVIKELKVLAGDDEGDEDDEETDAIAVRKEADILCEEANMPIEELRAKYSGNPLLQQNKHLKGQKQPSPMIKAKRSKAMTGNGAGGDSIKEQLDLKVEDEHPDNDNNLNTEKELKKTSSQNNTKGDNEDSIPDPKENSEAAVSSTSECNESAGKSAECKDRSEVSSEAVSTSSKDITSKPSSEASSSGCSSGTSSSVSSSSGSSATGSEAGSSVLSSFPEEASSSGVAGSSVSGCSSSGVSSGSGEPGSSGVSGSGKKPGITLADLDGDDLDSEDSEDTSDEDEEYNSDDYEDIEDEEEEEEGEEGPGLFNYVKQYADQPDEEPGSDSGCTAVVAMLRNKELFVANAGDSRCVLCRDGTAVDLSFDHKPEDKEEKDRIEAAGGQVTEDGRVNGGLNLSRALGDHYYKRNETKDPKDQMISAFPDVECTTLGDKDEFMILACDGIWNSLSSQECVDFVRARLKDEKNQKKPSLVCEELFDHCLAPNTSGDGTGCDNMTCIIVVFNQKDSPAAETKSDLDTSGTEEPPEKRQRKDEECVT